MLGVRLGAANLFLTTANGFAQCAQISLRAKPYPTVVRRETDKPKEEPGCLRAPRGDLMLSGSRMGRIVSFRVSEEQYQALKGLSASSRIRSVSELARCAIEQYLSNGSDRPGDLELRVEQLSNRVSLLDRAVERLSQIVNSRGPSGV